MRYFNAQIERALSAAKASREPYQLNRGRNEVLSAYAACQREGFENEYLNFDALWARDVPATVEALREFGVDYITVSDSSTELMAILAAFYAETCDIVGVTKVNYGLSWNPEDGPERVNALIISI